MDKLLFTVREAADMLGIGRSKLYELLRAGTVPSVRIGSCRRIAALDLADLVDKLRLADDAQL
ncbi:MAG TPA: helix-turn-helix domain-containing protein [Acidothermaceae bacterium]